MKRMKRTSLLWLISGIFCMLGAFLSFKGTPKELSTANVGGLIASHTYFGPSRPAPGDPKIVRVEVLIYDDPAPAGSQVQSVTFNHQSIPLQPRDINGYRGTASFQVRPGKYDLDWVVRMNKVIWPRTATREEIVDVSPKDLWIQIKIEGEKVSIT